MDENRSQTLPSEVPQTPPTSPLVQPQKGKKPLVLMVAIHLIAVATIGYLIYQNMQLKKQIPLPNTISITTPAPISSNRPTYIPTVVNDCSGNDKYSITIKEPSQNNGVGEFLVKYKDETQEFTIKEEVSYCIGLQNNFLVLDSGTSAGPRGLIVYDLDKKNKIFKGIYVDEKPKIVNNTISYWEPSDEIATETNCPDFLKNKNMGGGSAIDAYTQLNLTTLKKESLGQTKCDYRE